MNSLEQLIVQGGSSVFNNMLFFLPDYLKSATVTFLHHTLFPMLIFIFFFVLKPGNPLKILFLLIAIIGYIMFISFDKCLISDIEYSLCKDKNPLLQIIDSFYPGTQEESKIASKMSLSLIALFFGCNILYDIKWCNNLL